MATKSSSEPHPVARGMSEITNKTITHTRLSFKEVDRMEYQKSFAILSQKPNGHLDSKREKHKVVGLPPGCRGGCRSTQRRAAAHSITISRRSRLGI
ncbi:hypothetical protein LIER_09636 [Lithospermum erythrorhizon]|uniref:Uncharacterized protein n=1 Tax=Lithospermum erythrorhizon TaxID=34254 RepID=A0AAV3PHP2_LITER